MSTLDTMLLAPVLSMILSYWYLSNQQIFHNVLIPLQYADDVLKSGHSLFGHFYNFTFNQSYPVFVVSLVLLALVPFGYIVTAFLEYL